MNADENIIFFFEGRQYKISKAEYKMLSRICNHKDAEYRIIIRTKNDTEIIGHLTEYFNVQQLFPFDVTIPVEFILVNAGMKHNLKFYEIQDFHPEI